MLPTERFSDNNDIVLLPTEDFPFEFAVHLAKVLAADTNLRIRAVLNLGTSDWRPYSNAPQYDPATLNDYRPTGYRGSQENIWWFSLYPADYPGHQ